MGSVSVSGRTIQMRQDSYWNGPGFADFLFIVWDPSGTKILDVTNDSGSYDLTVGSDGTYTCRLQYWDGSAWKYDSLNGPSGDVGAVVDTVGPTAGYDNPTNDYGGTVNGGFSNGADDRSGFSRMTAELFSVGADGHWTSSRGLKSVSGTSGTFKWTGVPAGTYEIQYIAYDNSGNSSAPAVSARVVMPDLPPAAANGRISAKTATTMTFAWDYGGGNVGQYKVEAWWDGAKKASTTTGSNSFTVAPPPDKQVTFYVWQENVTGVGDPMSIVASSWQTPTGPTAPAISNLTPTTFRATWSGGTVDPSSALKYEYQVDGGAWAQSPNAGTQAYVDVTGLTAGASHTIAVRTVDTQGVASQPASTQVTTPGDSLAPRAPSFVKAVYINATTVHVSYDHTPEGEADPGGAGFSGFLLSIVRYGQPRCFLSYTGNGAQVEGFLTSTYIEGNPLALAPGPISQGGLYEIAVQSVDKAGNKSTTAILYRHEARQTKRVFPILNSGRRLAPRAARRVVPNNDVSRITGKPTNIVGTGNSQNPSINWSWDIVPLATGYEYSLNDGGTWTAVGSNAATTYGVSPASATIIVRAVNPIGPGPASDPVTKRYPSQSFG